MYVRTKTFTNKDGTTRTYLYLVEAKRSGGKVRQEVVANIGRLEKLQEGALDNLIEGLARYSRKRWLQDRAKELSLSCPDARTWGPVLIFRKLWEDMGLSETIEGLAGSTHIEYELDEAAFATVLLQARRAWIKEGSVPPLASNDLQTCLRRAETASLLQSPGSSL
jgi:hypothetical protein